MSEVKLHKVSVGADVNYVPDGWFRIIPATTAEIMAYHPKCKDCSSNNKEEYGVPWCYVFDVAILDPDNYYCRHWEGK